MVNRRVVLWGRGAYLPLPLSIHWDIDCPDNKTNKERYTIMRHHFPRERIHLVLVWTIIVLVGLSAWSTDSAQGYTPQTTLTDNTVQSQDWQTDFGLEDRELSDTGEGEFFILIPGFQLVLISQYETLTITVLDETKVINGITTRIVEEREEKRGNLYEVSRNFYAIDQATGDVFYFGEEVDFYRDGEIVGHSGEWLAYEGDNQPGLVMPGTPELGMKYYQEIAPGAAMDRAEVISLTETFETPAGTLEDCLVTEESSAIELTIEYKRYAPGIGLIQDQTLKLISYGYVDDSSDE